MSVTETQTATWANGWTASGQWCFVPESVHPPPSHASWVLPNRATCRMPLLLQASEMIALNVAEDCGS